MAPSKLAQNESLNASTSPCTICLDEVRCRGKLSVCDHLFCFGCIFEWSKNTNTCPLCKARFRSISKIHLSPMKSPTQKFRIRDKDQVSALDAEEDEEALYAVLDVLSEEDEGSYSRSIDSLHHWLDDYDLDDSFIDDSNISQDEANDQESDIDFGAYQDDSYFDIEFDSSNDDSNDDDNDWTRARGQTHVRTRQTNRSRSVISRPSASSSRQLRSRTRQNQETVTHTSSNRSPISRSQFVLRSSSRQTTSTPPRTRTTRSGRSARRTSTGPKSGRITRNTARNNRALDNDVIAINVHETGSSGWLSTSRSGMTNSYNHRSASNQVRSNAIHRNVETRSTTRASTTTHIPQVEIEMVSSNTSNTRRKSPRPVRNSTKTISYVYDSESGDDTIPDFPQRPTPNIRAAARIALGDYESDTENEAIFEFPQLRTDRQRTTSRGRVLQPIENIKPRENKNQKEISKKGKEKKEINGKDNNKNENTKKRKIQTTLNGFDTNNSILPNKRQCPRIDIDRPSTSRDYSNDNIAIENNEYKVKTSTDDSDNTDDETLIVPTPQDKKRSLFTRRQHKPLTSNENTQDGLPCHQQRKSRRRIKVYDLDSD